MNFPTPMNTNPTAPGLSGHRDCGRRRETADPRFLDQSRPEGGGRRKTVDPRPDRGGRRETVDRNQIPRALPESLLPRARAAGTAAPPPAGIHRVTATATTPRSRGRRRKTVDFRLLAALLLPLFLALASPTFAAETKTELNDVSINGGIKDGQARLVIEARVDPKTAESERLLFATRLRHVLKIGRERHQHVVRATFDILQGTRGELPLAIGGDGEIRSVTGDGLLDWSVRRETNGVRTLVLRPRPFTQPAAPLAVTIEAETRVPDGTNAVRLLTFQPLQASLLGGHLRIESTAESRATLVDISGLDPLETKFLPEDLRGDAPAGVPEVLGFRFQGTAYGATVATVPADPEAGRVTLRDFRLTGQLGSGTAEFTLAATARVTDPKGGRLVLLSGGAALGELERQAGWRLRLEQGQYQMVFDQPGEFPVRVRFHAAVRASNGWNQIQFQVAPAVLQPVAFLGLPADTRFEFAGAARPARDGDAFRSFLPADGSVSLSWKTTRPEAEGKLFYSAEMLSQASIGPGLLRQVARIDGKVMQGELVRLALRVRGTGQVTAVQGPQVLGWEEEAIAGTTDRRLVVRFNQPQKDAFAVVVQMQAELPAFPRAVDTLQIQPEGATRFAGHLRVVNEGAVRLEVVQSTGLSQVAPEQFPETDATRGLLSASGTQRFVFRFSGGDHALRVQADNILPELGVSALLAYHLGETEQTIDAEFELDIREAPLREVLLRVPKGYSVARLAAAGMSDYFVREPAGTNYAELRLVYGAPIVDRQIVQLRLERNLAAPSTNWVLPRVEVLRAKSTRGHVAVSADAGFRVAPDRTVGLGDLATAFFPRKVAGIQAAFRIADATWEASMRVERLPQSVQVDAFHLFSVGEGIAYGSSTLNYFVSGAPVSSFLVSLTDEYFNVEFTGKDLRGNWQRTTNGYRVTLNTPVTGAYTLLATYERPFKAQGDTLAFTGARPLDAQSEQGHVLVVSAYQFQVKPTQVSPGVIALETAEVPSEYRLFFDAPILAAYRYTARPFDLRLALSPLAQAETLGLVVDRATLSTRVSRDGEVLTDARYFVKNRGNPHLRLAIPATTTLWSATVNGTTVVPVKDGDASLIPMPPRADPNAVQTLDLKLASRSPRADRVQAVAPAVGAPVLLAEWKVLPDTGRRLVYRGGSLAPVRGIADHSGFATFSGLAPIHAIGALAAAILMALLANVALRWAGGAADGESGVRRKGGLALAFLAVVASVAVLVSLWEPTRQPEVHDAGDLAFLAPVQQPDGALSLDLGNLPLGDSFGSFMAAAWPALPGLALWVYAATRRRGTVRALALGGGWMLLAWAALRLPNGARVLLVLLLVFLAIHVAVPVLRAILARRPRPAAPSDPSPTAPVATTAALLLCAATGWFGTPKAHAATPDSAVAESVVQEARVEENQIFSTVHIRWNATKNQQLPLLAEPAVLTRVQFPTNALRLVPGNDPRRRVQRLWAQQDGTFDIELDYQMPASRRDGVAGFALPTRPGLVNRLALDFPQPDIEVVAADAVSIRHEARATPVPSTVVNLVLGPVADPWISWQPRTRDAGREKAVFFADVAHLFAPTAGVLEGVHHVVVRPAQGELSELVLEIPAGMTITDVADPAAPAPATDAKDKKSAPAAPIVSVWRFDPDTRRLRVALSPAQSRPFALVVRSQVAGGTLPSEVTASLPIVVGAAGQLGAVGIASGPEIQLDSVVADALAAINLEDFPATPLAVLRQAVPGATLRRAFRHADGKGSVALKASAVEPDVRVETQETLSLGEDRTVLAAKIALSVTRAGIFRLSFVLPTGLEVESASGPALSHWTELAGPAGRVVTLHLKGKTEGEQAFSVGLAGPGVRAGKGVPVPRLVIREASKQRGQLVVVPEQGMRLQVGARDGVTQLDPAASGIRQKGVLAFRLLQPAWTLALDVEQVDAWVQVTGLQHVSINEAQSRVAANLQYQIENTGLKSLRVRVPTNAEGLRFRGDQVADFIPVAGSVTNGLQTWEIKLHRRVIGRYLLQATWQSPLEANATNLVARGIQALDAQLQRGFVAIQSAGRLQARADVVPASLQPAEWQAIPRALLQDMPSTAAHLAFRVVEPAFELPLQIVRHEATKLLPARVSAVGLTSVISDEGVMLTQVRMDLIPGDKRLLQFTLPAGARFWFAFVNQNGVWPWRENDGILIPLEQQSRPDQPTTVEFFYSSKIGSPGARKLDLALQGPRFDLPLEGISWQVYLNEKWRLTDWTGTLQLEENTEVAAPASLDVQAYLQGEITFNQAKTKAAEQLLQQGNSLLERGDPAQARRAFQSAFGLSTHDQAFNEDARVQLHNLKLQQAVVGLNVRQSVAGGEAAAPGQAQNLRSRKDLNYTQQEAKQLFDGNSADDNATLAKLAERIVQQQDASVPSPASIRAAVPRQGRLLTFRRSVQVDTSTDMSLRLKAVSAGTTSGGQRAALLAGLGIALGVAIRLQPRRKEQGAGSVT